MSIKHASLPSSVDVGLLTAAPEYPLPTLSLPTSPSCYPLLVTLSLQHPLSLTWLHRFISVSVDLITVSQDVFSNLSFPNFAG